jgi:hypothetical protein
MEPPDKISQEKTRSSVARKDSKLAVDGYQFVHFPCKWPRNERDSKETTIQQIAKELTVYQVQELNEYIEWFRGFRNGRRSAWSCIVQFLQIIYETTT